MPEPALLMLLVIAWAALLWLPAAMLLRQAMRWIPDREITPFQALGTTLGAALFAAMVTFIVGFALASSGMSRGAEPSLPPVARGSIGVVVCAVALTAMVAGRYRVPPRASAMVAALTIGLSVCWVSALMTMWTVIIAAVG